MLVQPVPAFLTTCIDMLTPIPFVVVECTSGEASRLTNTSDGGEGWQSGRGCCQEERLVLKVEHVLVDGRAAKDDERMIHAIEIICHESKTPEKVGSVPPFVFLSLPLLQIIEHAFALTGRHLFRKR